jgi:hypothetical protein
MLPETSLLRCALRRNAGRSPNAPDLGRKGTNIPGVRSDIVSDSVSQYSAVRVIDMFEPTGLYIHIVVQTALLQLSTKGLPLLLLLLFLIVFARHYVSFPSDIPQQRPTKTHYLQIYSSKFLREKLIGRFKFERREPVEYSYLLTETPLKQKLYFATIA